MQFFFTFYEIFLFPQPISVIFFISHHRTFFLLNYLLSFIKGQGLVQYVLIHYILIQYALIVSTVIITIPSGYKM